MAEPATILAYIQSTIAVLAPAAAGLGGVWLGAWLTTRNQREARRFRFIQQQLQEFYAPLVSIRRAIRTKSEVRVKISTAAGNAWAELLEGKSPEQKREIGEREWPKFDKIITYNNEQLARDLLPSYREMLSVFSEKMWLAEESTKTHYHTVVEFVEVWNRWITDSLPAVVVEKLGHDEGRLASFYDDLERELKRLRDQLRAGEVALAATTTGWRRRRRGS